MFSFVLGTAGSRFHTTVSPFNDKYDVVLWSIQDFNPARRVRFIPTVDALFALLVQIILLANLQPRSL